MTRRAHLARQSPVCLLIYLLGLHLSKESKSFCASAEGMADYFDYDEKHIRRGLDSLEALGFLKVLTKKRYRPTVFRVLTHKQWAEKFPGQCVKKAEQPWSGEGDNPPLMLILLGGFLFEVDIRLIFAYP